MTASIAALKAHATIARSGMGVIRDLAASSGDDVVRTLVAGKADEVAASLAKLASRDAQVLIGPGVNFATDAGRAVSMIGTRVAAGIVPRADDVARAGTLVQRIASVIDRLT
jgi:hypothetical protein